MPAGTKVRVISAAPNPFSIFVIVLFLIASFALATSAERKNIVLPRSADLKALPFSDGVLVGDTLYIAGHIGLDQKTGQPPDSAEAEVRIAMDAIKQTVEAAGMTMDDVVSIQVYCTDLKLYDTFNSVYRTYFHGEYPARMFVGSNSLLRGGRFEVMGVAVKK